ncbi:MAG TPA: hypothetical protein VF885_08745 [Arthrobacter sp.]
MSKLKNKTDKATFRYRDVTVMLDGEKAAERDALMESIANSQSPNDVRLGQDPVAKARKALADLEDEMREAMVTVRLRALPTDKWNALTAQFPPRDGVTIDQRKEYNVVEVTKASVEAAGHLVEDGKTETVDAGEWPAFWESLSGGDFDRFWIATMALNEQDGWMGVDFLKKG